MEALGALLDQAALYVPVAVAVFARIGAAAAFLPGIGDALLPARVRLIGALVLTAIILPVVAPAPDLRFEDPVFFALTVGKEAVIGAFLGLSVRLVLFALQIAGAIISQNMSMTQLFGAGVGPDPDPAISTMLTLSAITLALTLGLHVKLVAALISAYDLMPLGARLTADIALGKVMTDVARAFSLAIALSAPILVGAFIYNLLLGAVNRAMPQLMVALVGMPALSLGGLLLLLVSMPIVLRIWIGELDGALLSVGGAG